MKILFESDRRAAQVYPVGQLADPSIGAEDPRVKDAERLVDIQVFRLPGIPQFPSFVRITYREFAGEHIENFDASFLIVSLDPTDTAVEKLLKGRYRYGYKIEKILPVRDLPPTTDNPPLPSGYSGRCGEIDFMFSNEIAFARRPGEREQMESILYPQPNRRIDL